MNADDLKKLTTESLKERAALLGQGFIVGQAVGLEAAEAARDYMQLYRGESDSA